MVKYSGMWNAISPFKKEVAQRHEKILTLIDKSMSKEVMLYCQISWEMTLRSGAAHRGFEGSKWERIIGCG